MAVYKIVRSPVIDDQELPEVHFHNNVDQPAIDLEDIPSGVTHDSLSGVTETQHHAKDHVTRHLAGGGDAFTAGNILTYNEVDTTNWAKNIIPDTDNSRDLGSSAKGWANIFGNSVKDKMGGSTTFNALISVANINTTAVGNSGTGEDDLITYSLPASSMTTNGNSVRITAWGSTVNNANAKTLKVYFGSQVILTTSLTVNQASFWRTSSIVFRTGSSAQDWHSQLLQSGATSIVDLEGGTATQTETSAITIKCTGEATDNSDIVQDGLLVEFIN